MPGILNDHPLCLKKSVRRIIMYDTRLVDGNSVFDCGTKFISQCSLSMTLQYFVVGVDAGAMSL